MQCCAMHSRECANLASCKAHGRTYIRLRGLNHRENYRAVIYRDTLKDYAIRNEMQYVPDTLCEGVECISSACVLLSSKSRVLSEDTVCAADSDTSMAATQKLT